MYCKKCGALVSDEGKFCETCGNSMVENTPEKSGIGWGILGFFVPLVGFILFLVWKSEKPKQANASGIGALIGFIGTLIAVFM